MSVKGAVFSGACLRDADLSPFYPYGNPFRPSRGVPNPVFVDFSGVDVRGADFTGADLSGMDGLERVVADESTIWPDGFDLAAAGVASESASANDVDVELQQADSRPASSAPEPLPAKPVVRVADELGKLADLCDRGVLSKEEFEKQKMKLLE